MIQGKGLYEFTTLFYMKYIAWYEGWMKKEGSEAGEESRGEEIDDTLVACRYTPLV